jgi:hypothetical protein
MGCKWILLKSFPERFFKKMINSAVFFSPSYSPIFLPFTLPEVQVQYQKFVTAFLWLWREQTHATSAEDKKKA